MLREIGRGIEGTSKSPAFGQSCPQGFMFTSRIMLASFGSGQMDATCTHGFWVVQDLPLPPEN